MSGATKPETTTEPKANSPNVKSASNKKAGTR